MTGRRRWRLRPDDWNDTLEVPHPWSQMIGKIRLIQCVTDRRIEDVRELPTVGRSATLGDSPQASDAVSAPGPAIVPEALSVTSTRSAGS